MKENHLIQKIIKLKLDYHKENFFIILKASSSLGSHIILIKNKYYSGTFISAIFE